MRMFTICNHLIALLWLLIEKGHVARMVNQEIHRAYNFLVEMSNEYRSLGRSGVGGSCFKNRHRLSLANLLGPPATFKYSYSLRDGLKVF
jgi:hypothetical protein